MENNIANHIRPLPMRELIVAPFRATMESQVALAESTYEFIKLLGFDDDGELKTIDFNVPIAENIEDGTITYKKEVVKAPLLSLLPIPSLMIDNVTIDFQLELKTSIDNINKYNTHNENTVKKLKLFSSKKTEMLGRVSESRENTRKGNQAAKYQVHVEAKMQQSPEGLQKMLDLIVARLTP